MTRRWLPLVLGLGLVLGGAGAPPAAAQTNPLFLAEFPPEVVFSDAIRKKADALGNDPVRIYEFVRNELEYQVYWGLMKGPEGALLSGGGNDYDLSALLVSMLRYSEVPARFTRGRVQVPHADAVAMAGVDDAASARRYWRYMEPREAWRTTPGLRVESTGSAIERFHVWVEALIPLARYRGAGGDPLERGRAWVPLDPAAKLRRAQPGIALPLGAPELQLGYMGPDGLYRSLDPRDVPEIVEDRVQRHLAQQDPGRTLADVPLWGPTVPMAPGIIPTATPYPYQDPDLDPLIAALRSNALAPLHDDQTPGLVDRWLYGFALYLCEETLDADECRQAGVNYLANKDAPGFTPDPSLRLVWIDASAAVEGQRVTLSFPPATPGQFPDGYTECPTNQNNWDTIATVKVDGVALEESASFHVLDGQVELCHEVRAVVVATPPGRAVASDIRSDHIIRAGGAFLLHLDAHGAGPGRTRLAAEALRQAEEAYPIVYDGDEVAHVDVNDSGDLDADDTPLAAHWEAQEALVGTLLHLASVRYAERMHSAWRRLADLHHRLLTRTPSVGMVSSQFQVDYLFDAAVGIRPQGLVLDIKGSLLSDLGSDAVPITQPAQDHYVQAAGHAGSENEHRVWEELAGVEAVSTVRGMQLLDALGEELLRVEDLEGAEALLSCRMDVAYGNPAKVRVFTEGQSVNPLVNAYPNIEGGGCDGIDVTTYCELKQRWAPQHGAWRAPGWDALCPRKFNFTTQELRVARRSRFAYRDWDGHVLFAIDNDGAGLDFAIAPYDGDVAGGGYPQSTPLWGHDMLYIDPFALGVNPNAFFTQPSLTVTEALEATGFFEGDNAEDDAAGAAALAGVDASLVTTNSAAVTGKTSGDPVNVIHGGYHHETEDLRVPGRGGFDLRLMRSYSSRLDYAGILGHGWIHTFEQHLRVEPGDAGDPADDRVIHVDARGGETIYFDEPDGFLTEPWVRNELRRDPDDGSYTLRLPGGLVHHYLPEQNGVARLDSVEDRNGNQIQCEYEGGGRLDYVLDSAGRRLEFDYDDTPTDPDHLRIVEVRDAWRPAGEQRVWRYVVGKTTDGDGDLVEYWDPEQTAAGSGTPVEYEYLSGQANPELDHNLACLTQPAERPVDTDGDGEPDTVGHWTMDFEYWAHDKVRSHTDTLGRTTTFDYNFYQRRTRVTHPDGGVEIHVFDRHGNIVRETSPRGVVRSFEYDEDVYEPILAVDGLGHETLARYDARGNVTWRKDREGHVETWLHNRFDQPLRHVDRRGAEQRWEYDERGNLLRVRAEVDGSLELIRSHEYDAFGNRVRTCEYAEPGGTGPACTRFEYDPLGVAVVRTVDPLGHTTRTEVDDVGRPVRVEVERTRADGSLERIVTTTGYDRLDRVIRSTDAAGLATVTVYDANGRVLRRETHAPVPGQTQPEIREDAVHEYDEMDRRIATADALGATTQFEYDARDRLVLTRTPLGNESRVEYDLDGNPVVEMDPTGARWERAYDPEGRLVRETDPLGKVRELTYDAEGRVVEEKEITPAGGERTLASMVYDPEGNPTQIRDAEEHLTQVVYDELGRRRSVTTAVGVPGEEATTLFEYDLQGRMIQRTDAEERVTHVRYDPLGRVTEVTDPLERTRHLVYDEVGNLVRTRDAGGAEVFFEYDARGLLTRRHGEDAAVPVDDTYAYDRRGRQVLARNDELTLTAEYDALDRPVAVHNELMGMARRAYDADGRVAQVVSPDGDAAGFPEGVGVAYHYTARGDLAAIVDPVAGIWRFAYDARGRLVRRIDPSGVEQWTEYTPEGFVDRVRLRFATGGSGVQDQDRIEYADYDDLGNPGTIRTYEDGIGQPATVTQVGYDAHSRVTSVAYPGAEDAEQFAYDRVGNRTGHVGRDGVAREYVVDAADELVAIRDASSGAFLEIFGHDAAGRRTSRFAVTEGTSTTYTYDALGHLVHFERSGGASPYAMALAYDATGHRLEREDAAATTRYFGEWAEAVEVDDVVTELRRLIHGGGIDRVVGEVGRATNTTRMYLADAAGNVTHVTEDPDGPAGPQGTILEWPPRRYEAFGQVRAGTSAVERGFAGRPPEGASGLINFRARHYDPATGRFLQPDPLGIEADQLYAYARSNPYVYGDPLGLDPQRVDSVAEGGTPAAASRPTTSAPARRTSPPVAARASGGVGEVWKQGSQPGQNRGTADPDGSIFDGRFGFGITLGGDAEGGLGVAGAAANADAGAIAFVNRGSVEVQDIVNYGAFAQAAGYGPSSDASRDNSVLGAFAGGGVNLVFTTANNLADLRSSLTKQANLNIGIGVRVLSIHVGITENQDFVFIYGGPLPFIPFTGLGLGASYSHTPSSTASPLRGQ